jgi:transposase InsO family protein
MEEVGDREVAELLGTTELGLLAPVTRTSTQRSTTTVVSPTPKCSPTNVKKLQHDFGNVLQFFASHGISVNEVITDNGSCYRSRIFNAALGDAIHLFTRPYRPQTNGKVERFNRTLLDEWAYVRPYDSEQSRTAALAEWLHLYNHHRCHTALRGEPPISRVNNQVGQYT